MTERAAERAAERAEGAADRSDPADDEIVVLPADGSVDAATAAALLERLRTEPDLDAVGVLDPVVDAVKRIDTTGRVEGDVDRSQLGVLGSLVAVRRRALDPLSGQPRPRRVGVV